MSQAVNNFLPLARTVVVGVVSTFSLIILALSAHLISLTNAYRAGAYYEFTALSLATALLSLLSLPVMLVISMKRKGAVTSMIMVELGWLWFLWVMWIASAGSTAALFWVNSCRSSVCGEAQAIEAFGFLNWLLIMAYTVSLLVSSIMAHLRGHTRVWTSSVREFDFAAPGVQTAFAPQSEFKGQSVVAQPQYAPQHGDGASQPTYYPPQHSGFSGTPTAPSPSTSPYPQV